MQISDGSLHPFEYGIRFIIELTQDSSVNLIGVELSIWNGEHLLKVKPCSEVTGHMASVAYIENGYWKWIEGRSAVAAVDISDPETLIQDEIF